MSAPPHLLIDLRAVDPRHPDAAGEYGLQLSAALVEVAVHASLTIVEPGFQGPLPAGDFLLLPAGGRPRPGYRCLTFVHELAPLIAGLGGFRARFRSAFAASRSELTVAPSEAVAGALRRYLRVPDRRLAVVRPGVSPHFAPAPGVEPGPDLLYFGDAALAHGAWGAAATPPGARLVAADRVERAELPALLAASTGVLLAEERCGNPIRALQAMACGAPPIVLDDGAYPEVVRDAGLTVGSHRPGDWAEAISALYRSRPLRAQLAARGRRLAAELSAERAARAVLALLEPRPGTGEDQGVDAREQDRQRRH